MIFKESNMKKDNHRMIMQSHHKNYESLYSLVYELKRNNLERNKMKTGQSFSFLSPRIFQASIVLIRFFFPITCFTRHQ